ncbi:restriction endonuclease subunit S [Bacillus altitudinis]|uniref:restriction endonuclease subunit S n=1 Tax=Bacillus altitudinis TaxID=293387 RepID=UPI0039E15B6C
MEFESITLSEAILTANTGADAIKRAPIVDYVTEFRCLRIGDISNDRPFNEWGYTTAEMSVREKFLLKKNDILIARTGNTIGVSKIIEKDMDAVFNNGLIRLRIKESFDPYFIYYLVSSKMFKEFIYQISGGTSTQPNVKINHVLSFPIPNMHLKVQRKISRTLKLLDDKFKQNNKMIYSLEQLAQTLFKRWFVDFEFPNENGDPYKSSGGEMVESELGMIPTGWEIGKLTDIAELIMGQSPKSSTYNIEGVGLGLINGASDFKEGIITPLKYTTDPKRIAKQGDFIFGVRATVGNVTHVDKEYAIGRGAGATRVLNKNYKEFLYFHLINGINFLESTASGSVYINLTKKDLEDIKLVLPPEEVIKHFHARFSSLLNMKFDKYEENNSLTSLRDTILPKLLSGEIELSDEAEVKENVPIS